MNNSSTKNLVIGMTGASGSIFGIRLLEALRAVDEVQTHLIMSASARLNVQIETDYTVNELKALADVNYDVRNVAAAVASGSFRTMGMVIVPCSMKTLSAIVNSYAENLLIRAADVTLKEKRSLILVPRETPLHTGHCRLLYEASTLGAMILPPMPAFYSRPATIDDIINHIVGRILDCFDIDTGLVRRWQGVGEARCSDRVTDLGVTADRVGENAEHESTNHRSKEIESEE